MTQAPDRKRKNQSSASKALLPAGGQPGSARINGADSLPLLGA
jgi:hypothetical protein